MYTYAQTRMHTYTHAHIRTCTHNVCRRFPQRSLCPPCCSPTHHEHVFLNIHFHNTHIPSYVSYVPMYNARMPSSKTHMHFPIIHSFACNSLPLVHFAWMFPPTHAFYMHIPTTRASHMHFTSCMSPPLACLPTYAMHARSRTIGLRSYYRTPTAPHRRCRLFAPVNAIPAPRFTPVVEYSSNGQYHPLTRIYACLNQIGRT